MVLLLTIMLVSMTTAYAGPKLVTQAGGSQIRSVAELQALQSITKPTKVMSGQINLNLMPQLRNLQISGMQKVYSGSASSAYKSGTGVVLKPSAMNHSATGSELHLFGAQMDQNLVNQVLAKSDAPVKMMCNAGQHANLGFLLGYFHNLPAGKHLYMLTMHMTVAADRASYLQFVAGSSFVDRSAIMQIGDDYMALLTFDPASGDGSMQVMAKFNVPADDALAFLDFSYLQLAQVD